MRFPLTLLIAVAISLNMASAAAGTQHMVTRARYRCGRKGARLGLSAGTFTVQYIDSGINAPAMGANGYVLIPFKGSLLKLQVGVSAGGARYETGRYTWWDAPTPSFTIDDGTPQEKSVDCKLVK